MKVPYAITSLRRHGNSWQNRLYSYAVEDGAAPAEPRKLRIGGEGRWPPTLRTALVVLASDALRVREHRLAVPGTITHSVKTETVMVVPDIHHVILQQVLAACAK